MPSFKAYLCSWYVWWKFKGAWQTAEGLRNRIAADREANISYAPPDFYRQRLNVEELDVEGCPVYRVSPKSEVPVEARVMYLHGGGFVFEMTPSHWSLVRKLAERLHASVTVPIYPLGPETQLLNMYAVIQPLYNEMAAADDKTPFWVMGDSAGGTMTFVLTQQALKAGLPAASRMVPITPCMDSSLANPELHEVAKRDPWLGTAGVEEIVRLICPDVGTTDPRVSPIYGDFSNLPPMLVFGASEDMLGPDAKKACELAREKGREAEFVHGEGMLHVWPLLPTYEAELAVDKIIGWLEKAKK